MGGQGAPRSCAMDGLGSDATARVSTTSVVDEPRAKRDQPREQAGPRGPPFLAPATPHPPFEAGSAGGPNIRRVAGVSGGTAVRSVERAPIDGAGAAAVIVTVVAPDENAWRASPPYRAVSG